MTSTPWSAKDLESLSLTIKTLSIDAVEKAKSGHPGMPMGTADLAAVCWSEFLNVNPKDPHWINRDRFVLSAGHGSMLLYSLLHLFGFDVSLEDLQAFRQWGSKTPGHPEFGHTAGVEATTGPLGQGTANAVGMALAQKWLAARFNRPGHEVISYKVYALVSDGDLMEGISSEAASLAGHLGLDSLVFIYDDNRISIDGGTDITFSEDIAERFTAQHWNVLKVDGHNHQEISNALGQAQKTTGRPTLIIARTHIAKGAPTKQDSASAHGAPLGANEVAAFKTAHGLDPKMQFNVAPDVEEACARRQREWAQAYETWQARFEAWKSSHPEAFAEFQALMQPTPEASVLDALLQDAPWAPESTRKLSNLLQQKLKTLCPSMVSGSADLAGSTFAVFNNEANVTAQSWSGRNIAYGIREHAMGAIANGLALSGLTPVTSTFLVFSDYMRPAIRVAALSRLQSIYVFTHDSFYLGEDGPTHQPIEHIPSLRLIPNLHVFRPANTRELAHAWDGALSRKDGPSALILSRQKLGNEDAADTSGPSYGGYIFKESSTATPELILVASGSEVSLALKVQSQLESARVATRVVSMPCLEQYAQQSTIYQDATLPKRVPTVVIEAARCDLWPRWISPEYLLIEMSGFGASAPDKDLAEHFGFTPEKIYQRIAQWLKRRSPTAADL